MVSRVIVILTALVLTAIVARGQSLSISRVERVGGEVLLYFDLADTLRGHTYTLNLYSSSDNFTTPLKKVTGDIGLEVKPGPNRKIAWNAKEEMGSAFKGDVALELRGKVYVPFVKLDGFDDYKKFKRNKAYNITWTGGRGNSVLNFDLYRGDTKVASYPNIANVGHHNLKFEKVKTGKNYRLRITDSKNKDDVVYSAPFKIRSKVPLLIKLLPVAGLGYLMTRLGGNDPEEEIINPPEPE